MGDMFVFPKGLVHFQYNIHAKAPEMQRGQTTIESKEVGGNSFPQFEFMLVDQMSHHTITSRPITFFTCGTLLSSGFMSTVQSKPWMI
ncbi:hypothetical protein FH972_026981 [Carpinus fangiana]|uniref:Cupin type-1 domain-containing protein n=1 Tax=Carpinus fangiana TaxID=176857 RepID=A0A5N6L5L3_9ROSI|nr:hypothetical protein FH972_026981 [Carpinus fangiana]